MSRFREQPLRSAAVCGSVFASPNPSQVRRGIDLVENDKGYAPVFIFLSYVPNGFDRVVIIVK